MSIDAARSRSPAALVAVLGGRHAARGLERSLHTLASPADITATGMARADIAEFPRQFRHFVRQLAHLRAHTVKFAVRLLGFAGSKGWSPLRIVVIVIIDVDFDLFLGRGRWCGGGRGVAVRSGHVRHGRRLRRCGTRRGVRRHHRSAYGDQG